MAPKDKEPIDIAAGGGGDEVKSTKLNNKKKDDTVTDDDKLSEEDRELKERLETCVSTTIEPDVTVPIRMTALDMIRTELRTATASMTSVPKPCLLYTSPSPRDRTRTRMPPSA